MPLIWLLLFLFLCLVGLCLFRQHPPEISQERGSPTWIQKKTSETNNPNAYTIPQTRTKSPLRSVPIHVLLPEEKTSHQPHDHTEPELPDVALTVRRLRKRRPEEAYEDQGFVEEIEDTVHLQKTNQQVVDGDTKTMEEEVIHGNPTSDALTETEEPEQGRDIETQTQATQTEESATQVESTQTETKEIALQEVAIQTTFLQETETDIDVQAQMQIETAEQASQTQAIDEIQEVTAYKTEAIQTSFLVDEPEENLSLDQQFQDLTSVSAVSFEKSPTQPIQFQPLFNSQPPFFSSLLVAQEEDIHRERPSPLLIDVRTIDSFLVETPFFPQLPTASLELSVSRSSELEVHPITLPHSLVWDRDTLLSEYIWDQSRHSLEGLARRKLSALSANIDEISFDFIQKPSLSSFDLSFDQERIVVPRKVSSVPFDIIEEPSQRTAPLGSYSIIDDNP